jgi:hypothetical protein
MIAALAFMALASAAPPCVDVVGADQLWRPTTNWVVVGEMHGTNETPDAFANLVCLAARKRRPITVALEYPVDEQPVIDRFLASDGGAAARAGLLAAPMWHRAFQDGRTSIAFLRLFERLRVMKQRSLIDGVAAFDMPESGTDPRDRNAAMADRLTALHQIPTRLVMVLVGNFHAIRKTIDRSGTTIRPAMSLLPAGQALSVNVVGNGGAAWNCQQDGCAAHDYGNGRDAVAGIILAPDADSRWDAVYSLAVPFTAAAPVFAGATPAAKPGQVIVKP